MKYIALDLETTGLKETEHDVVEVAAIHDDLSGPTSTKDPLKIIVIPYGDFKICPHVALMHQRIWKLMEYVNWCGKEVYYDEAIGVWFSRPQHVCELFKEWLGSDETITIAGKNPHFDKKFLEALPRWNLKIRHRMIDPSILWVEHGDDTIPGLTTCMERAGLDPSNLHTAYDDALAIRELIRRHPWSGRFGAGIQQALEKTYG